MYRDIIEAPEQIEVNGSTWWTQTFNGRNKTVYLYDTDGEYIGEFDSMDSVVEFLVGVNL